MAVICTNQLTPAHSLYLSASLSYFFSSFFSSPFILSACSCWLLFLLLPLGDHYKDDGCLFSSSSNVHSSLRMCVFVRWSLPSGEPVSCLLHSSYFHFGRLCAYFSFSLRIFLFLSPRSTQHYTWQVVQEYERAVIFRLGRLVTGGARGPGIFFIIPCIDTYSKVDLRTVSFDVPPQEVSYLASLCTFLFTLTHSLKYRRWLRSPFPPVGVICSPPLTFIDHRASLFFSVFFTRPHRLSHPCQL